MARMSHDSIYERRNAALSAGLGAVVGILIMRRQYTAYHIAVPFSVNGFATALIGGLGNPVLFFSSGYKEVVTFSIPLLFLLLRPGRSFGLPVEDEQSLLGRLLAAHPIGRPAFAIFSRFRLGRSRH
jgi:hypothetical protein